MSAYYNEIDPKTAAWLRELVKAGLIADGHVDERSIVDVRPGDLAGFTQCHFFAGIGGWSYALRLAGWTDDRVVWTGSCPCQPFSSAGKGRGKDDARHLWPQFRRLIRQCRPPVVFGEQVASKAGRVWLSAVFADLEALGYRAAGADLCGPSVGAFDIRQRLWFVADTESGDGRLPVLERRPLKAGAEPRRRGEASDLAITAGERRSTQPERDAGTNWRPETQPGRLRDVGELGDADGTGRQARGSLTAGEGRGDTGRVAEPTGQDAGWAAAEWIPCTDGRWRPVEPGTFPLAHGVPARVGRLRGYGNAIKPQVAAEFIGAYQEICNG